MALTASDRNRLPSDWNVCPELIGTNNPRIDTVTSCRADKPMTCTKSAAFHAPVIAPTAALGTIRVDHTNTVAASLGNTQLDGRPAAT